MKIKKKNKDLLNLYYKKDKILYYQEIDDIIYVTDGYVMFAIKKDDFMLNKDNLKEMKSIKDIIENDYKYVDAELTNELKLDDTLNRNKKDTCVYIKSKEDNIKCLVNTKYLEYFDNCEFKVLEPDKPVFIYEYGLFAGLVLPIKEN